MDLDFKLYTKKKKEENTMEEVKKETLETKMKKEEEELKKENKKNTFTLIYILVGLFGIAILGMLIYAFIVTR